MAVKRVFLGNDRERIPDLFYRGMALFIRAREALFKYSKRLETFGIQPGDTLIDYGCGPGGYIPKAAALVEAQGHVYAVDIQPLAVSDVAKLVEKRGLQNVTPLLAKGYSCPLDDDVADLIYMLDAFHMIEDPPALLSEMQRLLKPGGRLVLDDGHQSRRQTKKKVASSGSWKLVLENDDHLIYTYQNNQNEKEL